MDELATQLVAGGVIVALAVLGLGIVFILARRGQHTVQSLKRVREARRQQLVTFVQILKWTANILILVTALLMFLSNFGLDITPLLASAGVAGLAISLGAQSLIKDFVGGLLILMENQYAVGDFIEVGNASGHVEQITLRATYVRALDGDLHIVPNGEVRIVANRTREWSGVTVDLGVAYEEDMDRVLRILEEAAASFAQTQSWGRNYWRHRRYWA